MYRALKTYLVLLTQYIFVSPFNYTWTSNHYHKTIFLVNKFLDHIYREITNHHMKYTVEQCKITCIKILWLHTHKKFMWLLSYDLDLHYKDYDQILNCYNDLFARSQRADLSTQKKKEDYNNPWYVLHIWLLTMLQGACIHRPSNLPRRVCYNH